MFIDVAAKLLAIRNNMKCVNNRIIILIIIITRLPCCRSHRLIVHDAIHCTDNTDYVGEPKSN